MSPQGDSSHQGDNWKVTPGDMPTSGEMGWQGRNGSQESGSQDRRQEILGLGPSPATCGHRTRASHCMAQPSLICQCNRIVITGCNCCADLGFPTLVAWTV